LKKYLILAFALVALSARLPAQNRVTATLSAAAANCLTTNVCQALATPNMGSVTFTVSANASGNTIQFEATANGGTTWVALNATPSNSTTAATSTTSTGTWQANVAAYTAVRLRMSTLSGGTTTVTISTSPVSARSGGGGGGGSGTVTSIATTSPITGGTITTTGTIACPTCNTTNATVSSVSGTTNQIDVATGTTTPVVSIDSALQLPGTLTVPQNGALSQAAITETGTPITGGTGTTTYPYDYYKCTGATNPSTWSTSGTILGMNTCSGFAGNFIDFHLNGSASYFSASPSLFYVNATGGAQFTNSIQIGATSYITWTGSSYFESPSNGVFFFENHAGTGLTRIAIGPDTSSFPGLCPSGSGGALAIDVAGACTTPAPVTVGALTASTHSTATNCAANGTAANPSVASCSAAAAGMFSCATNASTGTCTVNTTAVTANSEITITQDAADGGASQLNVICNTGNVLSATAPILAAKVAATSFTINLGTVTANPACFEYIIVN